VDFYARNRRDGERVGAYRFAGIPGTLVQILRGDAGSMHDGTRGIYARVADELGCDIETAEHACEHARALYGMSVQTYAHAPSVAAALRAMGSVGAEVRKA
jgi:hypothetical protein